MTTTDNKKIKEATLEFEKMGLIGKGIDPVVKSLMSVVDEKIPSDMREIMALFTICAFVGHFKYKMKLDEDDIKPVNIVAIVLAKSGSGKSSSIKALEDSMKGGYEILESHRIAREQMLAASSGSNEAKEPESLSTTVSTGPGLIAKLDRMQDPLGLGIPTVIIDEFATEFQKGTDDLKDTLQVVAQLFDQGEYSEKALKDQENQTGSISNMGACGLFIGSEQTLLKDKDAFRRFETEMLSKYARRACFLYPAFKEINNEHMTLDEELALRKKNKGNKKERAVNISEMSKACALKALERQYQRILDVSEEMKDTYDFYKWFCEIRARKIDEERQKIEMDGRDWRAIKIASALSIFKCRDTLQLEDFAYVTSMFERFEDYLTKFMNKANRNSYQVLADEVILSGANFISYHELYSMQLIKSPANMKNLVIGANSFIGKKGRFEVVNEKGIAYQDLETVFLESIHCSVKDQSPIVMQIMMSLGANTNPAEARTMLKKQRARNMTDGFVYQESSFDTYGLILSNNVAYSPFRFKTREGGAITSLETSEHGIRGKDNICSGAQFVVLDIDDDGITIDEAEDMFCDYIYHMALTSDPQNPYKFRVLIPLDVIVSVNGTTWKQFMQRVGEHFGIEVDDLPQSQAFYGYANREVRSNMDGIQLNAEGLLKMTTEQVAKVTPIGAESKRQIQADLKSRFQYAYDIEPGKGVHMGLFKAMRHARDLGFSIEENREILNAIMSTYNEGIRDDYPASLESQRVSVYEKIEDNMEDAY